MTGSPEKQAGEWFCGNGMEDLASLMDFIDTRCRGAKVTDDAAFAIRLSVEEAFTNIIRHGYESGRGPVRVRVTASPEALTVTMEDEAPPFDPGDAPAPDLDSPWDEREPGGMGWHLVRQMMDEVDRDGRGGGGNILTLVKRLPGNDHGSKETV